MMNNNEWNRLSIRDKSAWIKFAVSNGINDTLKVALLYNLYKSGGHLFGEGDKIIYRDKDQYNKEHYNDRLSFAVSKDGIHVDEEGDFVYDAPYLALGLNDVVVKAPDLRAQKKVLYNPEYAGLSKAVLGLTMAGAVMPAISAASSLGTAGLSAVNSAADAFAATSLGAKAISAVLPWVPAIEMYFGYEGAKNFLGDEGYKKTYDLAQNGDYGRAALSGVGDLLDLSMVGSAVKPAILVGKSAYDLTKLGVNSTVNAIKLEYKKLYLNEVQEFLKDRDRGKYPGIPDWDILKHPFNTYAKSKALEDMSIHFSNKASKLNDVLKTITDEKDAVLNTPIDFVKQDNWIFDPRDSPLYQTNTNNNYSFKNPINGQEIQVSADVIKGGDPTFEMTQDFEGPTVKGYLRSPYEDTNYPGFIIPYGEITPASAINIDKPIELLREATKEYADLFNDILLGEGKLFGSNVAYGYLGIPGVGNDTEIITTAARKEAVDKLLKTETKKEGLAFKGKSPFGINNDVDVDLIEEKDGKAVGKVAHLIYRALYDDWYKIVKDAYKNETEAFNVPLPVSAEELFLKYSESTENAVKVNLNDMLGSSKDKHVERAFKILTLPEKDKQLALNLQIHMGKSLFGENYKSVKEMFPDIKFDDLEANKEVLKQLKLPEKFAEDPQAMEFILEKYNYENSATRRVDKRRLLKNTSLKDAIQTNYSPNGSYGAGYGGNNIMGSNTGAGLPYGSTLGALNYDRSAATNINNTLDFYNLLKREYIDGRYSESSYIFNDAEKEVINKYGYKADNFKDLVDEVFAKNNPEEIQKVFEELNFKRLRTSGYESWYSGNLDNKALNSIFFNENDLNSPIEIPRGLSKLENEPLNSENLRFLTIGTTKDAKELAKKATDLSDREVKVRDRINVLNTGSRIANNAKNSISYNLKEKLTEFSAASGILAAPVGGVALVANASSRAKRSEIEHDLPFIKEDGYNIRNYVRINLIRGEYLDELIDKVLEDYDMREWQILSREEYAKEHDSSEYYEDYVKQVKMHNSNVLYIKKYLENKK